jgi:hypothetical protein
MKFPFGRSLPDRIKHLGERLRNSCSPDLNLISRREIGRGLGIESGHRRAIKLLVPFAKAAINLTQPLVRHRALVQNEGALGRGERRSATNDGHRRQKTDEFPGPGETLQTPNEFDNQRIEGLTASLSCSIANFHS